jgi:Ca-activated chloride channel homolog
MIRFEYLLLLWLFLLTPIWIAGLLFSLSRRKRAAAQFVSAKLLNRVAYSWSETRIRLKIIVWVIAWTLLVAGAAGPQVGTKTEEVKREGIDVILAIDVSTSMTCSDLAPSRLENAKHEMQQFVGGLKGDRVGIIAFAGSAIVHCPLTTDYGAAKLLIRILQPDLISEQGTALADAIDAARTSFNNPDVKSRVLVIITDGEDHEEKAIEAATKAAEEGVRIYTIGMGTPQGAPIPVKDKRGLDAGFKRDKSGAIIVTKLNDLLLERIADAGGGKYLRGTQSAQELGAIWSDIASMEKKEFGKKQFTAFENRFQYFVLPALLLLLAEFFISERKGGWRPADVRARLRSLRLMVRKSS